MKNIKSLTLVLALQTLLATGAFAQSVSWRNDRTGAGISSWKTGDRIRVTVTNAPAGWSLVLAQGDGLGRTRDLASIYASSWNYAFNADGARPSTYGINSYTILITRWDPRYGTLRYPVSTLWRNG